MSDTLKLYKYLPFNEGAKKILTDGTIKFAHASEFNDPFDCVVEYDIKASAEYYSNRTDLIKRMGNKLGLSPAKRIQNKSKIVASATRLMLDESLRQDLLDCVGICCLSYKPDNILMWSHYADHHKGFLVEFTLDMQSVINRNKPEFHLVGWPVEYSEDMPIRNIGVRDHSSVQQHFLTKSPDWKYEKEYRVLSMNKNSESVESGPGIYPFNEELITGVVSGVKMDDSDHAELTVLVNALSDKLKSPITHIKAEMVKGKYKLNIKLKTSKTGQVPIK